MARRYRPPGSRQRQRRRTDARTGGFVGMGGLACLLFVYLASGGVLAWWGLVLLCLLWLVLLALGARWFIAHPGRVLALPVVGLLVWLAAVVVVARSR